MTEYNIDNEAAISAATAATEWDVYDKGNTNVIKKMTVAQLQAFSASNFPPAVFTTAALQSAVIPAADIVGGDVVHFINTGTTPATLTTDTATNIIAALPASKQVVGFGWTLFVRNGSSGANTATVAADASVTLTGTATIAQNTTRMFFAKITATGTPAVSLQSMGISAAAA